MKILMISTNVFPLPPSGYSGLEWLVYSWSVLFHRWGHDVTIVAPAGSQLPDGIDLIATQQYEGEDVSWGRYKEGLIRGEWDTGMDNSWHFFSVISQMEADRQLPIIHCYHSDPYNLGAPPPIVKPCMVAFSEAQANIIRRRWNVMCYVVHHGIDLSFYKADPNVKRGDRYLFLARYTPEKGFLEIAHVAKKCRVGLDAFGDTTIVASQDYVTKCFNEANGREIKVSGGIPREECVKQYQSHKALITWPNFCEIFGLTSIECMATGTPVISKDSGAARELIRHGKTGFVVGTLEELEWLIKTDAVAKIKPEDCVRQAKRFSIEKSAAGHLRLLKEVGENGLFW